MSTAIPYLCIEPGDRSRDIVSRDVVERVICESGGTIVGPDRARGMFWLAGRRPEATDAQTVRQLLDTHPGIGWVQITTAGADALRSTLDTEHTWTSAKGAFAEPIAEFVLAVTLASLKQLPTYARLRDWNRLSSRTLHGARITILGAGGIASSLIGLFKPFTSEIVIVRLHDRPVIDATKVVTADKLRDVLPTTDILVLALALTTQTEQIIGKDELAALPSHALIVNVSRGSHIDTDALTDSLLEERIGGAVLDVTDPEPLPAEHPLWMIERCLITPHTACTPAAAEPYLLSRLSDNVRRFSFGEPLVGRIDPQLGY